MNIGEASSTSGVSTKMIRYYESIGLIPAAARTEAGYRLYSDVDVHTLRFIRAARDLGFAVEQIEELLVLWRDRSRASADVKRLALEHIEEIEHKIEELRQLVHTLKHLADHCRGDQRPQCPIVDTLDDSHAPEGRLVKSTPFGRNDMNSASRGRATGSRGHRLGRHA
jgi:MerR family copper efflux transcriptional regulator